MKPCKGVTSCRTCDYYKNCTYDTKHKPKTAKRIKLKRKPKLMKCKPISPKDLYQAQEYGSYISDLIDFLYRKGL